MATDNKAIYGVWELASLDVQNQAGYESWGTGIRGLLMYATTGHMSVSIVKDPPSGSDEVRKFAPLMIFYAGTFELKDNYMLHRAELSHDPERFSNVHRRVELEGNTLILRTPEEDAQQVRLTWKRIGGPPA